MFPTNDDQHEEVAITKVQAAGKSGWTVTFDSGFGFFVPPDSPIEPKPGMTARLYGKGLGHRVRGLFLDGEQVFYRTDSEDAEHFEIEMYGADAADMLRKWDEGETVHTIEMGGLGPGYEQALQIAMFEILRFLIVEKPDADLWKEQEIWAEWREKIHALVALKGLGLSGAQVGAATSLATALYSRGPRTCLREVPKGRHTMVSKNFPQAPEAATA